MTFTPDPEKISRYRPGRRPYVEVTIDGRKVHARVSGWQGEMILLSYPARIINKFTHGQRDAIGYTNPWLFVSVARIP